MATAAAAPTAAAELVGKSSLKTAFGVPAFDDDDMDTVACVVATAPDAAAPLLLHRIADAAALQHVRAAVKDLACDDARVARFPGPNPVSLDTSHFSRLAGEAYYVCEKTDGVRFALVCCRVPAGDSKPLNVCALLDRSLTAYVLPQRWLPRAAYQGTLLDGEVAWNKVRRRWEFLAFDAVCVSGIPVMHAPLTQRMDAVHRVLRVLTDARSRAAGTGGGADTDPVDLVPKTFVPCRSLREFEDRLPRLRASYDIDGVVLTPAAAPVAFGRHPGMFKLKFDARHTVDFLVGADGRQLSVFDSGAHVVVGTLAPGHAAPAGAIAECGVAPGAAPDAIARWVVVTVRSDKPTANDMLTYRKTLLNMRENLGMADLRRLFLK